MAVDAFTRPTVPAPPIAENDESAHRTSAKMLAASPVALADDHPEVSEECDPSGVFPAQHSEADLLDRVGSFERTLIVRATAAEIRALPLDPAAAFLLGMMDGMLTIEMLLDMSPLPRPDVTRSLCLLIDHKVVTAH